MTNILYVCEYCAQGSPETCGHYTPAELRVMPSGLWICVDCYECDDTIPEGVTDWNDLPQPPNYIKEHGLHAANIARLQLMHRDMAEVAGKLGEENDKLRTKLAEAEQYISLLEAGSNPDEFNDAYARGIPVER